MAFYINRAEVLGNVGQDPDIRSTNTGKKVASFSVATSEHWTDKQTGEKQEHTDWHRITVWNEKLVEIVEKYVRKGTKVYVSGALKTRKWQDKEGVDRYTTEIVLNGFDGKIGLLGEPKGGVPHAAETGEPAGRPSGRTAAPPGHSGNGGGRPALDDDIPF